MCAINKAAATPSATTAVSRAEAHSATGDGGNAPSSVILFKRRVVKEDEEKEEKFQKIKRCLSKRAEKAMDKAKSQFVPVLPAEIELEAALKIIPRSFTA